MKLPSIKLDFLKLLTDETGLLQHTKYGTPCRREGYATDDNARALIVCTKHFALFREPEVTKLIHTYLSFLFYMQRTDGRMHNFLSYDRKFLDDVGSEDCMGHTIWACGHCLNSKLSKETKLLAKEVFDGTLKWALSFTSPRAQALSILGLFEYHKAYPTEQTAISNMKLLSDKLVKGFERESSDAWNWFESYLTYANARLPHALFQSYECTRKPKYLETASESMNFLLDVQKLNGLFVPVGNLGWFKKGAKRAVYDQQPIEAACTVEAAVAAYQSTHIEKYRQDAFQAFDWFLGKNLQDINVYDCKTASCCDGITPLGLNLNKGAEATISYLQARLSLEEVTIIDLSKYCN